MDDSISRKAAIDALWKSLFAYEDEMEKKFQESYGSDIDEWIVHRIFVEYMNDIDRKTILELPSAQPERKWIPVKMRPMDSEEREYWEDQFGEELEDEDAVMFDCPMPKDGQEILVSYRKWIGMDKCEIDGGCYGLEGNGDWEDVIAWMPLPEPYNAERREE